MQVLSKMVGARIHVLAAALVGTLMMVGCGTSTSPNTVTATPSFSPAGGNFSSSQAVTITDTTSGAVLYCTTDGTTPTTSSPQCSQPITVFKSEYLQAIAVAPGLTASAVAAAGYTINLPAAATPTFSPAGGTYAGTQSISIADATTGANIFYTTDGTVPTASSTLYSGPITVSKTQTISAIAVASGFSNSGVASAVYTINLLTATPVFSPVGGTYTSAQTVAISDATAGAVIYYTTDGSAPTTGSTKYSGAIAVSKTETISAIAVATGLSNSSVATATYTINIPTATPTFSPAAGTYTSAQPVSISDATTGAVIYYTVDGSTPTTTATGSTQQYSGPITVSKTETISAIAVAPGFTNSSVATAAYTVNLNSTATPTFSPAAGTYTSAQPVSISDATTGAVIYYTVDGSTPTTTATGSTQQYSGPITVSKTETINALAVAPGDSNSSVATALYTLSGVSSTLNGTVLSGSLPVNGAQVQLYAAGQSGYGSAATALLGAPVVTNSSGVFTLTYNCQAPQGDLVYLIATGGDTGAGANSSLELMAALGSCSNLTASTKIVVNEVTTVASAYALSAFITTAPNVGSSSTNYQGLTNAFNTVSNLVDTTTGKALTITPAYAANPVLYLNSSTVPQARIDTLANILNGCVNSNGAICANLFSAATPPAGTAPANSLQAIVNIAQNPGTDVTSLFGLASSTGPFQPVLAAAPGDWTMALTFTGGGLGIPPGTTGTFTSGQAAFSSVGPTFSAGLAIDAIGNVWVAAYGENSQSPIVPILAKFNNLGAPLTPPTTLGTGTTPVVTFGGYNPEPSNGVGLNTIAIDQSGTVWLGDTEFYLLNVSPSLSAAPTPINAALAEKANSIALDNNGNVWAGSGLLSEFQSNGTAILSGVHGYPPGGVTTPSYVNLTGLVFDSSVGLWGADSNSANGGYDVYQIDTSSGVIAYDAFPPPAVGGKGNPLTLVADGARNIYGCADATGQSLNVFNSSGTAVSTYPITTTRGCGSQLVLDGQGHIFSLQSLSAFQTLVTIDEFTTTGVLLSSANGYTGSSAGEPITLNPAADTDYVHGTSEAVDGSGNLWVLNSETNGFDANFNLQSGNVLVEYVGIAAPVVTPTSVALVNGQLGARP